MTRQKVLKDTLSYGTASYLAQGIGVVNSILLRKFMGPVSMGIWSVLQVILGYCGYASLGTTRALMRDYPQMRGRGDHGRAERLKNLVLTFSLLGSLLPAALIALYLLLRWEDLAEVLRMGLLFICLFLFVQRFYDLIVGLLRSDKRFGTLSRLIVLNALGGLAVTLLLVSRWNIYGLFVGTAAVMAGCLAFIYRNRPYRFKFFWDRRDLWQELKVGLPLVGGALLLNVLRSMDKLIIAKGLGFYEVGIYSVVTMVTSYLMSLPMMFAHVWYPNLQHAYGRHQAAAKVRNYLLKPVLILAVLVPFLSGLAFFLVPVVVELFIPKFLAGLAPMKVYLVGIYFLLLGEFSGNFLITINHYLVIIPILLLSVALNLAANLTALYLGWGLIGIAGGCALSFMSYGVISYLVACRHLGGSPEGTSALASGFWRLALCFGGIFLIDRWVAGPGLYATAALKLLLLGALFFPLFHSLEKRTSLFQDLAHAFLKKPKVEPPVPGEEEAGGGVR